MTSREKFEAFLVSEYEWGNDALNAANFHGDDATGYYTGGDFIYDGQSCSECLFWAWRGWQAAELAAEKKLTDMAVQLANAESKCRELAAELSAVDKIHNEAVFITDDHYEQCPPEVQKMIRSLAVLQIPAYDAFLAEVRASELDSLAGVAETMLVKFSNQRCSQDMHEVVGWKMVLQQASNRAAKLRKGAVL
ncbi:hypothetical protein [Citrobacter braakii]|uniref:hypothetical protein n=1 Tax=Citrobacter braakii TaxID=57706 RepID=UPI001C7CB893|nr:hypothetical protein [Citrobacter braakii]